MSDMQHDAPSIRIVNELLAKAVEIGASDIHLESYPANMQVRLRIDGILHLKQVIDVAHALQVLNRIKVLAKLDIAEKRMPQDGKFLHTLPSCEVDLRISTFPTLHGEKMVVRILDRSGAKLIPEQLGFEPDMLAKLKKIVSRPQGFFVVTGPTGSGKTTTLYALVSYIHSSQINIATLEDPIEYYIEGINQTQIHPAIGFTFARGIRSLLRQDPDIIMIGEIRDEETAHVALQAALTGHLVMSSIHTSDAPTTVMRLLDMSIEPFLLNTALSAVLSQRLARKLCQKCKYQIEPSEIEMAYIKQHALPIQRVFVSPGCANCLQTGYQGRVGIFELLEISHELRALITTQPNFRAIYAQALQDGMKPLLYDAAEKVTAGLISMQELISLFL